MEARKGGEVKQIKEEVGGETEKGEEVGEETRREGDRREEERRVGVD